MEATGTQRLTHKKMDQYDLVKHHYSRRAQWGRDSVIYRKSHPMSWKRVVGTYQNWEIDSSAIVPTDAESPYGEAAKLFYSDDLALWLSCRRESMPYFYRNCDGDELHLITRGEMVYETDFGTITVHDGDLLLISKGVTYRTVMRQPQDTLRIIYESGPEMFLVPAEMVDHIYGKGRPPVDQEKIEKPKLSLGPKPEGEFEVRVKYSGAYADFLGETSSIFYDGYPLDVEIIDGEVPVFKFNVADIERLGTTPIAFLGGAYLDNKNNLAWTLHLSGSGGGSAPVHRDPDVDELRYYVSGPKMGNMEFTPQGVDHGAGRGYTRKERNAPKGPYDSGDSISAYTMKPLKGTPLSYRCARPHIC